MEEPAPSTRSRAGDQNKAVKKPKMSMPDEIDDDNDAKMHSNNGRREQSETKDRSADNEQGLNIPTCFAGKSFYEVLGIPKTATVEEITKAYRRLSLKHHPDRNTNSPSATEEFQYLAKIHETLAKDPRRRAMYDKHGNDLFGLTENMSDEFMDAYEYWREVFPELQTDDIEAYKASYIGSEEEIQDIIDGWDEFKGDLFLMIRDKIFFADSTSVERISSIIESLQESGRLKNAEKYESNYAKSLTTCKRKLEKLEKEQTEAFEEEQKAMKDKENASSRSGKAKAGNEESLNQLVELLRSNKESRGSFLDALEAKYAPAGVSSKKKSVKKASESASTKTKASKR